MKNILFKDIVCWCRNKARNKCLTVLGSDLTNVDASDHQLILDTWLLSCLCILLLCLQCLQWVTLVHGHGAAPWWPLLWPETRWNSRYCLQHLIMSIIVNYQCHHQNTSWQTTATINIININEIKFMRVFQLMLTLKSVIWELSLK